MKSGFFHNQSIAEFIIPKDKYFPFRFVLHCFPTCRCLKRKIECVAKGHIQIENHNTVAPSMRHFSVSSRLIFNNVIKCQLIKLILRKQQQKITLERQYKQNTSIFWGGSIDL